jgi:hypothetical protein
VAKVREILYKLGIEHQAYEKPRDSSKHRQCWIVVVGRLTTCLTLLTAVQPYLVAKQFPADRVIEFCARRLKLHNERYKNVPYELEDYEGILAICNAGPNLKGVSETVRKAIARLKIQSDPQTKAEEAGRNDLLAGELARR